MKTKNSPKLMFILVASLVFIMSSFSVSGASSSLARFDVTLLNYDPSPAEPGSYVDVEIQATNTGDNTANNVRFELMPEYPFSLDSSEKALKEYTQVGPTKSVVLQYKLRVDPQAVFGDMPLKIRYSKDGGNWQTEEVTINVRTSEAILVIESIDTPGSMKPGETQPVSLTLKNLAEATVKDVSIKLDLATETYSTTAGVSTVDLPFIPVGSGLEKRAKFLDAGEEKTFTYNLMTYGDADSKIYKIPVTLEYKDQSGTQYTTSEILGLVVSAEPRLSIEVQEANLYQSNGYGMVTLRIVNKGVTDVHYLTASIEDCEEYETQCMTEHVYVGNVDSDDYETVEFQLRPKEKEFSLKLDLEFKDANNKQFEQEFEVPLAASDSSQKSQGISWVNIVLILLVIVGVVLYLRHRKKKKHHDR